MRVGAVLILVVAIAAVAILWPREGDPPAASPCGPVGSLPSEIGLAASARATVCLVNRERTQRKLKPLKLNELLNTASLEHSNDMVQRGYFEHATPDGRSVADRLRALGYSRGVSASAGENIAYGIDDKSTPKSIVEAWMKSPGHRADILRPAFTQIGIGIALGAPTPEATSTNSATYTTDFGGTFDPSLGNS